MPFIYPNVQAAAFSSTNFHPCSHASHTSRQQLTSIPSVCVQQKIPGKSRAGIKLPGGQALDGNLCRLLLHHICSRLAMKNNFSFPIFTLHILLALFLFILLSGNGQVEAGFNEGREPLLRKDGLPVLRILPRRALSAEARLRR